MNNIYFSGDEPETARCIDEVEDYTPQLHWRMCLESLEMDPRLISADVNAFKLKDVCRGMGGIDMGIFKTLKPSYMLVI